MTALWFFETRVIVRVSSRDGDDGISVLEHIAREGDSAPLHVHREEDEIFHILDGVLTLVIDGARTQASAGDTLIARKGTRHTYRVDSPAGARWLTITKGPFESFVRALARSPEHEGLPDPAGEPSEAELQHASEVARAHGIELVGPPLH